MFTVVAIFKNPYFTAIKSTSLAQLCFANQVKKIMLFLSVSTGILTIALKLFDVSIGTAKDSSTNLGFIESLSNRNAAGISCID